MKGSEDNKMTKKFIIQEYIMFALLVFVRTFGKNKDPKAEAVFEVLLLWITSRRVISPNLEVSRFAVLPSNHNYFLF